MTSDLKLSQQLCFSFYTINKLFHQLYKQVLMPYDLTYTQYLVLLVLWEKNDRQLHEVGECLNLASNTLTPLLRRLEQKQLITRVRLETDKRHLHIHLTSQGLQLYQQLQPEISEFFEQLQVLEDYQHDQLLQNNQKLIKLLENRLS
ncbi:MarR family winged helix-turn-helix transcriptional regulator [Streptococcus halichoeri]|uniref:MarR family winged helix-turn-helix transcriptional regulator n=1 Tax=Streptococcus halichoeri TaxID=254785 RepID=UPI001357F5D9|nr:MarR family transcriptional regulator [Streptococcus halichoeri]